MFAVVKIAGQQFKVEKDQTLFVPNLEGSVGDKLEFSEVLLADADGKLSVGDAVKAKIQAEIVDYVKGDKVIAYKQKRRKGFHKKLGHRTHYTKIRVTDITEIKGTDISESKVKSKPKESTLEKSEI